jgi:hypothetical protein
VCVLCTVCCVKAAKCVIKFGKKGTWKKFAMDLKEDYKGNKKVIIWSNEEYYESKTELSCILDKKGEIAWKKDAYL